MLSGHGVRLSPPNFLYLPGWGLVRQTHYVSRSAYGLQPIPHTEDFFKVISSALVQAVMIPRIGGPPRGSVLWATTNPIASELPINIEPRGEGRRYAIDSSTGLLKITLKIDSVYRKNVFLGKRFAEQKYEPWGRDADTPSQGVPHCRPLKKTL